MKGTLGILPAVPFLLVSTPPPGQTACWQHVKTMQSTSSSCAPVRIGLTPNSASCAQIKDEIENLHQCEYGVREMNVCVCFLQGLLMRTIAINPQLQENKMFLLARRVIRQVFGQSRSQIDIEKMYMPE
jgi:hypothetical protein